VPPNGGQLTSWLAQSSVHFERAREATREQVACRALAQLPGRRARVARKSLCGGRIVNCCLGRPLRSLQGRPLLAQSAGAASERLACGRAEMAPHVRVGAEWQRLQHGRRSEWRPRRASGLCAQLEAEPARQVEWLLAATSRQEAAFSFLPRIWLGHPPLLELCRR